MGGRHYAPSGSRTRTAQAARREDPVVAHTDGDDAGVATSVLTPEPPDTASSLQLATTASSAFGWSFVNTAVSRLGTLGIGILLARLLGPSEFGTYAVATVALLAMLSFNELGISLAIVRWPGDPRTIFSTVNTLSCLSSTVLCGLVFIAAPGFSSAMNDPTATPIVRLMGLSIIINGLVAGPAALLQREFAQKRRMMADQVNVWLGAAISIALALSGLGAMSLALGRIAGSLVSGAMFLRYSPIRYRFGLDRSCLRPLLRFGLPLAGTSIIVFAVGYADQLVVGNVLGSTNLGYYVLAFNLASWPVSMFSQPLRSVAPAMFARLQHDRSAMLSNFMSVVAVLGAVTLPACFLLAGLSQPLVEFVYGPEWSAAAPVLTWLAIMAAFRIFFELTYDFLVVAGRSSGIFTIQVVWVVALIPALVLGSHLGGTSGVAISQLAVGGLIVAPLYLGLLRHAGVRIMEMLRRLVPIAIIALLLAAGGYALTYSRLPNLVVLAVAGTTAALVVSALLFLDRSSLRELRPRRDGTT